MNCCAGCNGLQTSFYTTCHYNCPVTVYVYNRYSYAITLCTTGNQIIGILYHTYAFVQYICIIWTGLGQQHIATCLLLQLGKKIRFRKDANGVPLWGHPHCSSLSSVCVSIQCSPTVPPYNWWPWCTTDKTIPTTTKQQDPVQNAAQHFTPLAHHQQEQNHPTALLWAIGCTGQTHWPAATPDVSAPLWTIGCPDELTRLQPRRITAPLQTIGCQDGLTRLQPRWITMPLRTIGCPGCTCLQPHHTSAQLQTTSCPRRTHSSAVLPDQSAHLCQLTTQAPKRQ